MFRHSLTLSLLTPLLVLLVILMVTVALDQWTQKSMPALHGMSVMLIGAAVAWIPVSLYLRIRRRVLNPLRELRQKFMRVDRDRLEMMRLPVSKDEISDVVAGYNQMVSALSAERDERLRYERERLLQSQLVALGLQADGLVHELASPLSTLSTLSKLAAEGDRESAKAAEKEARALAERLRRFMALFQSRRVSVRPFDLGRLISARIGLMECGDKQIRFDPGESPCEILSDEILAGEIIDNLLKNAIRHARSAVYVTMSGPGSEAEVTVSDDGSGITPQAGEKLFRPFYTSAPDGHGLGLFISRLWAQALGGRLELASARDPAHGGASFRLSLPVGLHPASAS